MVGSYLFVLRRRLPFVLCLTAVLAPLLFLLLQSRPAEYASQAVIEVGTGTVAEQVIGQQRSYEEPERRVATQADAVTSRPVAELAAKRLGAADTATAEELVSRITAEPRPATDYIDVTGTGFTPRSAQQVTEAFTTAFLDYRRSLQRAELERLERDLVQQRRDAEAALAALPAGGGASRDRDVLVGRLDNVVRLIEAVRLRLSIDQIDVELLSAPSLPEKPSNDVSPVAAMIAAVLGAGLVGMALAFAIDLLRDGIRTRGEAEEVAGAPVIATVTRPRQRSGRRRPEPAEARALRLGLTAAAGGVLPSRTMIVAIPGEAEEAKDVAALLAESCQDGGLRVLVFADNAGDVMPPPAVLPAPHGATVSLGELEVRESLQPGVWLGSAAGPAEDGALFDVPAPAYALEEAARHFDVVVVVVESENGVDPEAVHHLFEAVVVVCQLGRTPSRRLRALAERLKYSQRGISAVVLTTAPRLHGRPDPGPGDPARVRSAPPLMTSGAPAPALSSPQARRGSA